MITTVVILFQGSEKLITCSYTIYFMLNINNIQNVATHQLDQANDHQQKNKN